MDRMDHSHCEAVIASLEWERTQLRLALRALTHPMVFGQHGEGPLARYVATHDIATWEHARALAG